MTPKLYTMTDDELSNVLRVAAKSQHPAWPVMPDVANAAYNFGIQRGRDWVPVEERLPNSGPVLAMVTRLHDGKRTAILRTRYVNKHEIECNGDYEGDADYDETSDRHCWPVGWYEWNECEKTHWFVAGDVTHWQPLPQPPETSK